MARSSGYRATSANREQVGLLRAQLAACRGHEWQRAGMIMQAIVAALGQGSGPMGARVQPRACRYCNYYGHTRQHCKVRARDEEVQDGRDTRKQLRALQAVEAQLEDPPDPAWSAQCARADARYAAACDAGWGCRAAESACGVRAGCVGWRAFAQQWEEEHAP